MKEKISKTTVLLLLLVTSFVNLYPLSKNIETEEILNLKWGKSPGEVGLEKVMNVMGPRSFYVDRNKNSYILDNRNYRIEIFDSSGEYTKDISLKTISSYSVIKFTDLIVDDSQYIYILGYYMGNTNPISPISLTTIKNGQVVNENNYNYIKFKASTGIKNITYLSGNPLKEFMTGSEKLFIRDGRIWLDLGDYTYLLGKLPYYKKPPKKLGLIRRIPENTKYFKSEISHDIDMEKILNKKYGSDWVYVGEYNNQYIINTVDDSISIFKKDGKLAKRIDMGFNIKYFTGNYLLLSPEGILYVMENDSAGMKLSAVRLAQWGI